MVTFEGGILFLIENKKNEKCPDYSGELIIDTIAVKVVGWNRIDKKSGYFIKIAKDKGNGHNDQQGVSEKKS